MDFMNWEMTFQWKMLPERIKYTLIVPLSESWMEMGIRLPMRQNRCLQGSRIPMLLT